MSDNSIVLLITDVPRYKRLKGIIIIIQEKQGDKQAANRQRKKMEVRNNVLFNINYFISLIKVLGRPLEISCSECL